MNFLWDYLDIDLSHWQDKIKYAIWAQYIKNMIAKASQGDYLTDERFIEHATGALHNGIGLEAYHWFDPTRPAIAQVDRFLKATDGWPVKIFWMDFEQYWSNWTTRAKMNASALSNAAYIFYEELKKRAPGKVGIYSRTTLIEYYCPQAIDWMKDAKLWLALYPYASGVVKTQWEYFREKHLPTYIHDIETPVGLENNVVRWQFTGDKFILPGYLSVIDVNVQEASYLEWTGDVVVSPPVVVPTSQFPCTLEVLSWKGSNVRLTPEVLSSNLVGGLLSAARPIAFEAKMVGNDLAYRIGDNLWIFGEYQGNILARPV